MNLSVVYIPMTRRERCRIDGPSRGRPFLQLIRCERRCLCRSSRSRPLGFCWRVSRACSARPNPALSLVRLQRARLGVVGGRTARLPASCAQIADGLLGRCVGLYGRSVPGRVQKTRIPVGGGPLESKQPGLERVGRRASRVENIAQGNQVGLLLGRL